VVVIGRVGAVGSHFVSNCCCCSCGGSSDAVYVHLIECWGRSGCCCCCVVAEGAWLFHQMTVVIVQTAVIGRTVGAVGPVVSMGTVGPVVSMGTVGHVVVGTVGLFVSIGTVGHVLSMFTVTEVY
jgi:hypothetical protein